MNENTTTHAGPMASAILAMQAGLNISEVKALQVEQSAWEKDQARKAFVADMAAFKVSPPEILKDKTAFKPDGDGGFESYDYATIGNVCEQIIKAAAAHGFSHRWVPSRSPVGGNIEISCELAHRGGHIETTRLDAPAERDPSLTVAQSEQSVRTFLQRYSLLMAFGFAPKDNPDDDGRGGADMPKPADDSVIQGWCIYAKDAKTLEALAEVRKQAATAFSDAGDVRGWNTVKLALDARLQELGGAT